MLTFTAHWPRSAVAPSAAYLAVIASGLGHAHRWCARRSAAYLASRPGAAGAWRAEQVAALL